MIDTRHRGRRICSCDEKHMLAMRRQNGGQIARWDGGDRPHPWDGEQWTDTPRNIGLRWWFDGAFGGVTRSTVTEAMQQSLDEISQHFALEFEQARSESEAHIVIDTGRIDGAGGTLAYAELPFGPDRQLPQKMDSQETWWFDAGTPRRGIHFRAVFKHEIGHNIGFEHIAAGNLLAPTYDPRILDYQQGDIHEGVLRYGPHVRNTSPDVPSVPTNPGERMRVTISTPGTYELNRVSD